MTRAPDGPGRPSPPAARSSLWRHHDFMRLWWADAISQLGTQVTVLALPLVAILVLDASPVEVGLLGAAEFGPFLLFGLPAGAWVDRLRRRPILIAADLGRALLLASVPVAHWAGALTIGQLLVVAFAAGTLTVFFDVAHMSYLPVLVPADRLVEGNANMEIARSFGYVAGPAGGGALVQLLTAPVALLVDAASFVGSALSLLGIRRAESRPERQTVRTSVRAEVAEGLRYVFSHPLLRPQAASTALFNLFGAFFNAVFLLYAARQLGLSPGVIGLTFAGGALAIPITAALARRITHALGLGRTILAATVLDVAASLLVPAAPVDSPVPWLVAAFFTLNVGVVLYNVNQVSLRQAITPGPMLGRMNATMRFVVWGTLPLGSLIGGAFGSAIGLRPTLWVGALGTGLAVVPIAWSPIRRLVDIRSATREWGSRAASP